MKTGQILGNTESAGPMGRVSLPLGLALGSPIFPSGGEGTLGVALEPDLHTKEEMVDRLVLEQFVMCVPPD